MHAWDHEQGWTPLHEAVAALPPPPPSRAATSHHRRRHYAKSPKQAHRRALSVLRLLLDWGARPWQPDRGAGGLTPVHLAAMAGHTQVLRLLLRHQQQQPTAPSAGPLSGVTPLHLCVAADHAPATALLLRMVWRTITTTLPLVLPELIHGFMA